VLRGLTENKDGGAVIEYALIVALMSIAIVNALQVVSSNLTAVFEKVAEAL
jgi:Flp pilus assembly pilin Flp